MEATVPKGALCEAFFETETGTELQSGPLEIAATLAVVPDDHAAVVRLRRILSTEHSPPIDAVLATGVLPRIVALVSPTSPNVATAFEAAWALTNVLSGTSEHTRKAIEAGAIPALCSLVFAVVNSLERGPLPASSSSAAEAAAQNVPMYLAEQAVWGLGNAAGDCAAVRDIVLATGVLPAIAALAERCVGQPENTSLLRNCAWTLSNLVRAKPPPPADRVLPHLRTYCRIASRTEDPEVITDCLWALSYIADSLLDRIPEDVLRGIVAVAVPNLYSSDMNRVMPAVRAIGNIATGTHTATQIVVDSGALKAFCTLLDSPKKVVVKESCWVLSNITAGTLQQVVAVLEQGDLFSKVVAIAEGSKHFELEVRKEAIWTISNAVAASNREVAKQLVGLGCLRPLARALETRDNRLVRAVLESLQSLFNFFIEEDEREALKTQFEECGGLELLEALQEDPNEQVYSAAVRILEDVFAASEEGEEEDGREEGGEEQGKDMNDDDIKKN